MKLIDLIPYLTTPNKLEEFYEINNLTVAAEGTMIYMKEVLSIYSEIAFFGIEKTEGYILYKENGIRYIYLLSITSAKELIDDLLVMGYNDSELAEQLIEYGINDA
jgi:hypothetical protein